jgi:hypothetical protein
VVTESVARDSGLSSYAAYIVKVSQPIKITIERRYREFDALREAMLLRWPGVFIPILPPKHSGGSNTLKVVNERIKYLTYFLNCIAKTKCLFLSEEFQLFLNSNSSDLKKLFDKMQKPTYESIVLRYEKVFPEIRPDKTAKGELMSKVNDLVNPFYNYLKETEILLINIKKSLYRLAVKREDYIRGLGDLYTDTLPEFEKYISETCEEASLVLLKS